MPKLGDSIPLIERFWSKVVKTDYCWLWHGASTYGYGAIRRPKPFKMIKAHRLSWELHYGPIPKGMFVRHSCDNSLCVNPKHLWLGTNKDNKKDNVTKGREIGRGPISGKSNRWAR